MATVKKINVTHDRSKHSHFPHNFAQVLVIISTLANYNNIDIFKVNFEEVLKQLEHEVLPDCSLNSASTL